MSWEFPLILKAVQWVTEKVGRIFSARSKKREEYRDSLGELLKQAHLFFRGNLARRVAKKRPLPADQVMDKEKELVDSRNFLWENQHRYTPEIQELIEALLEFALNKDYDSMAITFKVLEATIKVEQAKS